MSRSNVALPRTDVTVKELLTDLSDPRHNVNTLPFTADLRIARMFWPEKVTWSHDIQMEGWSCSNFKPFSNMSHAVALVRHVVQDPRLTIEIQGDTTRVTIFSQTLQAGVCAQDLRPEYAVCKALLNGRLVFDGAMYGYVLGMGIMQDGYERPRVHPEEISSHLTYGDIQRGGLGKADTEERKPRLA
jgi:hypothetical protein